MTSGAPQGRPGLVQRGRRAPGGPVQSHAIAAPHGPAGDRPLPRAASGPVHWRDHAFAVAPPHAAAVAGRRALHLADASAVAEALLAAYDKTVWIVGRTRDAVHFSDQARTFRAQASATNDGHALLLTLFERGSSPCHVTFGNARRYLGDPDAMARVLPTF